jgi:hypothetical protein
VLSTSIDDGLDVVATNANRPSEVVATPNGLPLTGTMDVLTFSGGAGAMFVVHGGVAASGWMTAAAGPAGAPAVAVITAAAAEPKTLRRRMIPMVSTGEGKQ